MFGGNGYSAQTNSLLLGVGNPYVYPDNLPRVNAKEGRKADRDAGNRSPVTFGRRRTWSWIPVLRSRPTTTSSPGQPMLTEYVWGRQVGEPAINP